MTFGSKMDDAVNPMLLHKGQDGIKITDVCLHKGIIGPVLYVLQVGKVAGVGQFININYVIIRIFLSKKTNHVAAYKPGTSGNHHSTFHFTRFKRY